jgi:hypothetical protein
MIPRNGASPMRAAVAAFALAAACPLPAAAQDLSSCNCDDVREIRDRWCSARAARAEYSRIADFLKNERGRSGSTRMFSNEDKRMINQKCVQEAINSASDRGVVKATAVTHENHPIESLTKDECRIEVTREGTACLKQIVQAHEGVHRQACLWRNEFVKKGYAGILSQMEISSALGLHFLGDTKYLMSSSEFAFEEAVSYATEMQMIADKWKELQQRCVSKAFDAEIDNPGTVGDGLWNNASVVRDASGKESRIYRMYDLSADPCPSRPRPAKSECTLR